MKNLLITKRGRVEDLYTMGTIAVVNSKGQLAYSNGDPSEAAFSRSSEKLMQALTPLSLGAEKEFFLTNKEIAVICASHSGEKFHIETIKGILEKIGLDESYLKCGAHYPFKKDVELEMRKRGENPRQIHNNCSGKHAGMLMAAKLLNADLDRYYSPDYPVQVKIRNIISELCEYEIKDSEIAVDGCGVPVHAMPIYNYAYGMAKMGARENLPEKLEAPCERIINSITENPEYTSGTDRIDFKIIGKYPGDIIVKSGANGFFGGLMPKMKLGFGIKIYDGNSDTRNVLLIALLKKFGIIKKEDYDYFEKAAPTLIKNHRDEVVGEMIIKL